MRRSGLMMAAGIVCAALLCMPGAAHAKRGMPEYVVEKDCGVEDVGEPKVLIAFATYYGSTYRVAERIAEVLCSTGFQTHLRFAKNVTREDVLHYDAVIVGSTIYIEAWHADALQLLSTNEDILSGMPVAYFCVNGLLGMDMDNKHEIVDEHYLQPMYAMFPAIQPLDVVGFAGAVDYRILKIRDWLLLRLIMMPGGNWTDWDEVEAWAQDISAQLQ